MAARRLLIVMLILLGLSTLAAALVPQHNLRRETTTAVTTTQPAQTAPVAKCGPPFHVGDQITLLVLSTFPTQLEIKQFGLISFATPQAPARFELLPTEPATYGILYAPSGRVAARLEVLPAGGKAKPKKKQKAAKSGARGGSGQS
jgi:hypothetical protein